MELFPYIHLDSLRASAVKSIDELDRYAWKGHAFLMGRRRNTCRDSLVGRGKGLHYENPDEANLVLNLGQNEQPSKVGKEVVLIGVNSSG